MLQDLPRVVLAKIEHQLDRVRHLASLVPADKLDWTPPIPRGFTAGVLLGHLLESVSGFCAVLYAANPGRLGHFLELRKLQVNQRTDLPTADTLLARYLERIREGFSLLSDADMARKIPTVFVPDGEALLSLLLINIEHLASHKQQLFMYLRMMGLPVGSSDLYHFSGS